MANWKKAKQWLKEGKKIRLPQWTEGVFISGHDPIKYMDKKPCVFATYQFEDDRWEIFEEKKPLKKGDAVKFLSQGRCYLFADDTAQNMKLKKWKIEQIPVEGSLGVVIGVDETSLDQTVFGVRIHGRDYLIDEPSLEKLKYPVTFGNSRRKIDVDEDGQIYHESYSHWCDSVPILAKAAQLAKDIQEVEDEYGR